MINDLQTRKLDRAFGHLDVDKNGSIEYQDLIDLASRLLSAFEVTPASDKGQAVLDSFEGFWDAMVAAADMDGDRRLSPQEWRAGMSGAFIERDGGFDRSMRPAVKAVADLLDTDGNGTLSIEEFRAMQRAFGTAAEDVEPAFARIDTDGSGELTVGELVEAARQFYIGADESAPGNSFFGPI
ncbi:EF-hand domain-containing protein [Phytomonospora endophytica]|uniref:Ca2+-binding EF-hand superfamily protein n=1 Tax=Phytomonospora endophytica TaxID=714109 RepID=A0A841FQP2_9ACTN|nr:EF-hand domain-containing protein [Phytomonospora endophytica]MBB6035577.1 Ca2+-binding EF-hand superfamily protein [Phytomonospora endophytica]GIG70061.1 hypothetical protein Pen01_63560 [Phytomonospora endophytica]